MLSAGSQQTQRCRNALICCAPAPMRLPLRWPPAACFLPLPPPRRGEGGPDLPPTLPAAVDTVGLGFGTRLGLPLAAAATAVSDTAALAVAGRSSVPPPALRADSARAAEAAANACRREGLLPSSMRPVPAVRPRRNTASEASAHCFSSTRLQGSKKRQRGLRLQRCRTAQDTGHLQPPPTVPALRCSAQAVSSTAVRCSGCIHPIQVQHEAT